MDILEEIITERERQKSKGYDESEDDQWSAFDWHEMIADYNGWARRMWAMGSIQKARRRFIQVAALAIAAIEAIDRRYTENVHID